MLSQVQGQSILMPLLSAFTCWILIHSFFWNDQTWHFKSVEAAATHKEGTPLNLFINDC